MKEGCVPVQMGRLPGNRPCGGGWVNWGGIDEFHIAQLDLFRRQHFGQQPTGSHYQYLFNPCGRYCWVDDSGFCVCGLGLDWLQDQQQQAEEEDELAACVTQQRVMRKKVTDAVAAYVTKRRARKKVEEEATTGKAERAMKERDEEER